MFLIYLRGTNGSKFKKLWCELISDKTSGIRILILWHSFILVFIFSAVLLAVLSDLLYAKLSRTILLAVGTTTFSLACLLMGLSTQYWHLVLLRMLIAMGLAVCR